MRLPLLIELRQYILKQMLYSLDYIVADAKDFYGASIDITRLLRQLE